MTDSRTIVCLHCARTLPDSLSERKELLVALGNLITSQHPAFNEIEAHLALITSMEELQSELPLKFTSPSAPAKAPSTDGN